MVTRMKLSVLIITYNHERFIGEALDSVLAQQTNFNVELVVGDDCSTDRTRNVVAEDDRVRIRGDVVGQE